jgi:hypothetical protein
MNYGGEVRCGEVCGSGDAAAWVQQRAHVFRENRRNLKGTNGSASDMMFNRCTMADTSAKYH